MSHPVSYVMSLIFIKQMYMKQINEDDALKQGIID